MPTKTSILSGVLLLSTLILPARSQERWQARSMVISEQGIVATSQTLASQAGATILARGGNAIDAAIAANAVMNVVEPMSNGIGGDLFAIYRDAKTGKITGINSSGWSPKAMTAAALDEHGFKAMPQKGIWSVTVPGCVAGWEALHRKYGKLPWADLFQPAIYYAEHGYPVTEIIHGLWHSAHDKLSGDAYAATVFLPGGHAPAVGQVFRNPALAKAYRLIARDGARAFYQGPIGEAILAKEKAMGGPMVMADLAEYQPEWVDPLSTEYRGWKVYELPPNGQGFATLEMLNLMEHYPLGDKDQLSPDALHIEIEAQKLAYQDLARYLADPRFGPVPVEALISKPYAADRVKLIAPAKANCKVNPGNPIAHTGDTIYLSTVDSDGNIVSLIQSLYNGFGSGVAVDGFGFHLQNRGGLFTLEKGHPNQVAGRKRPFHTIIPGFMEKDNVHIGFGIMGGLNQAQAHAQFVSDVVDHGMNVQQALEAPRFTKMDFAGCNVLIESRFPPATIERLTSFGHQLEVRAA